MISVRKTLLALGFVTGAGLASAATTLLQPALCAADRVFSRDRRVTIDGFAARYGVICGCCHGVLSAPPRPQPRQFDLIFEAPAAAPFALQVATAFAALDAVIAHSRGIIACAQNL